MEVYDAVFSRRSVRKYKAELISEKDLQSILIAGIQAPSGMNMQPWYFVAIRNPEVLEEIKQKMQAGIEEFKMLLETRFSEHPEVVTDTTSFISTLGGAPAVILAFIRKPNYEKSKFTLIQSIAAAIQNMLLAAFAKGIGTCWLTAPNELGISEWLRQRFAEDCGDFVAMITLGYPDGETRKPKRHEDRMTIIS